MKNRCDRKHKHKTFSFRKHKVLFIYLRLLGDLNLLLTCRGYFTGNSHIYLLIILFPPVF